MSGPLYFDRVQETSVTAGTGTFALAGALLSFQSFDLVGAGNTCYYCAVDVNTNGAPLGDFEIGLGTVGARTLSRDTVYTSSNANAKVNWQAGSRRIFLTQPSFELAARQQFVALVNTWGKWTDIPFNAANFVTKNGTAVWTITSAAVVTNRYCFVSKIMLWEISLSWTAGAGSNDLSTGTTSQLAIKMPGGLTALTGGRNNLAYATAGGKGASGEIALQYLTNGVEIVLTKKDATVLPAGTLGFYGQFLIGLV